MIIKNEDNIKNVKIQKDKCGGKEQGTKTEKNVQYISKN